MQIDAKLMQVTAVQITSFIHTAVQYEIHGEHQMLYLHSFDIEDLVRWHLVVLCFFENQGWAPLNVA